MTGKTQEEKIYTISGQGFSATCDAFAVSPKTENIWFASMIGSLRAVRAITANLCTNPPVRVFINSDDPMDHYRSFTPAEPNMRNWEHREQKLPNTQLHHSLVYSTRAKYGTAGHLFVILCQDPEEAPDRHYRFLDQRVAIPLHPSWAGWLWEEGLANESIVPLESHGIRAYLCQVYEPMTMDLISQAIQKGTLQTP